MPEPVKIGRLRWPVELLRREQVPTPGGTGITESEEEPRIVHADIQPLGPLVFYGAINASGDQAPTHKIIVRWTDYLPFTYAVRRVTNRPDGSQRTEMFRVRRVAEVDGRKRFTELWCQLETAA